MGKLRHYLLNPLNLLKLLLEHSGANHWWITQLMKIILTRYRDHSDKDGKRMSSLDLHFTMLIKVSSEFLAALKVWYFNFPILKRQSSPKCCHKITKSVLGWHTLTAPISKFQCLDQGMDLNTWYLHQVLKWPTFGGNPSPLGSRPYQAGSDWYYHGHG